MSRAVTLFNFFLYLIVALNVVLYLVIFTGIDNYFLQDLGFVARFRYHLFLFEYTPAVLGYALGALTIALGIRREFSGKSGTALIALPLSLMIVSLLERFGILLGAVTAS